MLNYGIDRVRDLMRLSASAAIENQEEITYSSVSDILDYLSRKTDVSTVRAALKNRFAIGIEKTENGEGFETYVKGMVEKAIDVGLYEAVSGGLGNKIINSLANLFSMPNQSFKFVSPDGVAVEDVEMLINEHREAGAFDVEMITADRIASAVETCPVLIQLAGGHLSYQSFSPAAMHVMFNSNIIDNGAIRATNQLDIEDASCVVIQLANSNEYGQNNGTYLAIYGRSEDFPLGRYVQYSSNNWKNIPRIGDINAVDYEINGEICNPLSWIAAKAKSNVPEYPIIIIRGGQSLVRNKLIEITSSLYESCVEIDVALSRVLKDSLSAATGTKVIKNPGGEILPRTLEGNIVLNGMQTIEFLSQNGGNATVALGVISEISKSVASGFSVPDYQIIQSGPAESGIALYIKTKPLIEHRSFRVKLNAPQITKLFEIEKGLIELSTGISLGDVTQIWDAGSYNIPESEIDKVNSLNAAVDAKYISYVSAVRKFNNLSSDEDAIALIEQIKMQNEEYGPTVKEPAAPVVVDPAPMAPEPDEDETIEESNG